MKVTSNTRPEPVAIEKRWDGKLIARLTENVTEETLQDEEEDPITLYHYDEYIHESDWSDTERRKIESNPAYFLALHKTSSV